MPNLNVDRITHASCSFSNRYVFVYGGIDSKKYTPLNSIEKLDMSNSKMFEMKWELLEFRGEQLDALQNAKMLQINPYEICIFGKGSAAYYDVRDNTTTRSKHRPC